MGLWCLGIMHVVQKEIIKMLIFKDSWFEPCGYNQVLSSIYLFALL